MSTTDAAFDLRPETFQRIGVRDAIHPLFGGMVDAAMFVAERLERLVAHPFVGANQAPGQHLFDDMREQSPAAGVVHDARDDIAVSFRHSEHDGLFGTASRDAVLLAALAPSADIGFVHFDMARQAAIAVNVAHVFADFVAHAPRRFVGHAQLALQFLRRDAMPRRGEKIHRIEPFLQRRMRPLERRSCHRMDVMPAPLTGISGQFREARKAALPAAFGALKRLAVSDFHKVVQANIIIRETLEKVLNCERLSHFVPPYSRNIEAWRTYVKGIFACHHL